MLRPAVVITVLCLVGATATAAWYVHGSENGQDQDWGQPEQPELRAAGEIVLSASDLGPDWHASAPSPMNLTGLSYIDRAMAGFDRRSTGANSRSPWH